MVKVWPVEEPPAGGGLNAVTVAVPPLMMSVAGIAAVSCVLLTNVVDRLAPFQFTRVLVKKPVPLTVSVKPPPPAVALAGAIDVIVGTGLLIVNGVGPELPPPGAGLNTATGLGPAEAISLAGTAAVSFVLLTKVVVSGIPWIPNCTTDVETKFVPLTVRVKAGPPAVALVGEIVAIDGRGLFTVNVAAADVPPPGAGFVTVTLNVPAVAISAAAIAAVNCVALTNVVVFAVPLKLTVEVDTKFVPFTVSVNAAPPAVALLGERVVMVGNGLLMVKVADAEVPPPGAGFVTVTLIVPPVAISAARMAAVSCVALTNAVVFAAPLKFTTAPLTKPVPLTVSVNAAPPAVALAGDSDVMTGAGFVPVPLSVTTCVVLLASSVIVSVAVLAFNALGVNVKLITQFAPAFTVAPLMHVVPTATAKSPAFAPPMTAAFDAARCKMSVPPLVSVTVIAPLVVLMT